MNPSTSRAGLTTTTKRAHDKELFGQVLCLERLVTRKPVRVYRTRLDRVPSRWTWPQQTLLRPRQLCNHTICACMSTYHTIKHVNVYVHAMRIHVSIYLPTYLSIRLSFYQPISLSIYVAVFRSVYPSMKTNVYIRSQCLIYSCVHACKQSRSNDKQVCVEVYGHNIAQGCTNRADSRIFVRCTAAALHAGGVSRSRRHVPGFADFIHGHELN